MAMNFFEKSFKFIYGFFLFVNYARRLDFNSLVKGRRIAIVGAANSAYNTGKGEYIDGFDFVIRINKAPYVLKEGKWKRDLGTKADILFHNFFENEQSGGGRLDLELYKTLGINHIINPIPTYLGYRAMFNFYKKYLTKYPTYWLSKKSFQATKSQLGKYYPTTGFCALQACLESDFSELFITGFTFFKTAFGEGYRDALKEAHQVRKYLKDAGLHNPDLEFEQFLKILTSNKSKNIILDDTLQAIVNNSHKRKC